MCGIVGCCGDMSLKLKEGFKDMLLINQVRGRDATGAFSVTSNDEVRYAKMVGTPEILFELKSFDSQVMFGLPKVLVGHCRSKTVGDNTRANAHPYDFDNVIGVHNGTLRSVHKLSGHDYKRTDSYTLYDNISDSGLTETMTEVDPAGAWALVWWDKTDNTLNFLRNKERPLWFTWTADKRAMIWASEPGMFWAMRRKVELWDGKQPDGTQVSPVHELPENTHWKFSIHDRAKQGDPVMYMHPVREVIATGNFTQYRGPNNSGGTNHNRVPWDWQKKPLATGGEVARPFPLPDDNLDGIGPQLKLPDLSTSSSQAESTTTTDSSASSKTNSSNVADFRLASINGTKSSKNTLSLTPRPSKNSEQMPSEKSSDNSDSCTVSHFPELPKKQVSLRCINGVWYLTDNASGIEWAERVFENHTRGICSFCKTPIGTLEEVHAIFRNGHAFICTSCVQDKKRVA